MIKAKIGERLDAWIRALLPFLFRRKLDPNLLTVVGTLVSLSAAIAFGLGAFRSAALLLLAGGFFDLVDGVIARHHGVTTRFGAFLDSTLDRLVDMGVLIGVAVFYAGAGELGNVLLSGWALASSVLVSYAKARAEQLVPKCEVGIFERAERILILAAGAVGGFVVTALWIIAIGSTITVIQRFAHAYQEMERIDANERNGLGERT